METVIEISETLWLIIEKAEIESTGLFSIRDDTGGDTLIDRAEIPALIEALKGLLKTYES